MNKDRKEEFQAVHYLIPDTWELEKLTPVGPIPYPGTMGRIHFSENSVNVSLVISDVISKSEFEALLAVRGLKISSRKKKPFNDKMEIFETEAL